MSIKHLQKLAGIITENADNDDWLANQQDIADRKQQDQQPQQDGGKVYTFLIVDPATGEYTKYGSGSILQIMNQLKNDPENSRIADVIRNMNIGDKAQAGGNIFMPYDGDLYMFTPGA